MGASPTQEPIAFLGEVLIDLICPTPVEALERAPCFEPHPGGALANAAAGASLAGAPARLFGAVGQDAFGLMVRRRLSELGVDTGGLEVVDGLETGFALVTLDEHGEPSFEIRGSSIEDGVGRLLGREDEILEGAGMLVVGSNTLVGSRSRDATLRAVEAARERGLPVGFDVNLRAGRWADLDVARELASGVAARARLLKCNRAEAAWLAGLPADSGARALASGLVELAGPGAIVALTLGSDGAILAGAVEAEASAPAAELVSPLGAGDAFMGTLCAHLHLSGWSASRAEEGLERAVGAGAAAAGRLGALPD